MISSQRGSSLLTISNYPEIAFALALAVIADSGDERR
jgi:hypothetical protein